MTGPRLKQPIKVKVKCSLCGDEEIYNRKIKRRCPKGRTHKWLVVKRSGDSQ